jgi:hypothetical protein
LPALDLKAGVRRHRLRWLGPHHRGCEAHWDDPEKQPNAHTPRDVLRWVHTLASLL